MCQVPPSVGLLEFFLSPYIDHGYIISYKWTIVKYFSEKK